MRQWRRLAGAGAAALASLLAACDQGPATQPSGPRSPATWSSVIHAAKSGPIWVQVAGNPFALPVEALADKVAEAMHGSILGRDFTFTAHRDRAPEPQFRTVIQFAPQRIADAEAACAGALPPPFEAGAAAEAIHLLGVFCSRAQPMAAATGWVKRVQGPDDPRFRQLLQQTARELFREG